MSNFLPQIPTMPTSQRWVEDEECPIWDICEEITNKKEWYTKIFNKNITDYWRRELPVGSGDNFDFVVKLLQATAQGSIHLPNCDWDEGSRLCRDCLYELKQGILQTPEDFGLTSEDIDFDFFEQPGWEQDYEECMDCQHPRCGCTAPDSSLASYVEYRPEGVVNAELHDQCKRVIADLAAKEPIDYHPGSNNQVRDLIHPSMYCYVKGVSEHYDETVEEQVDESVRYQWLPSEFSIDINGKTTVSTYINNLKEEQYPEFVPTVERVFEAFLPSLEHVLKRSLRDQFVQVIVKVGHIVLTPDSPIYPGGSFHIEGMPYEHIAATCIHYVDVDNITDSFLEFRKPTIVNEENIDYPQSDDVYTSHHYGLTEHYDGEMNRYLGLIRCHEGASVVFPNSLQHRVKEFGLVDPTKSSLRTILAFFVIDPDHTIISTEDVPPQQEIFTVEQANFHRERLMFHRKFFVNQLNKEVFERPFSLCEH